ncbi:hypothetical protein [Miltoncostaea oceani]|uniref:hypothetical protein n=1 Tax=Miltoncostaea oceani TaxID=2843216 RepID=UPI001C3CEBAB|nr:hypothetical protein [Miltoncostaea oceani]
MVFTPHSRTKGKVVSDGGGTVEIEWEGQEERDELTYSRFAIAFDWVGDRWELIY